MQRAWIGAVVFGSVGVLVACVGGPGSLPDQGLEREEQTVPSAEAPAPSATTSTGGSKGSSSTARISASEYSRSCSADSDCVAVYEGSLCSTCRCPNAVIATSNLSSYTTKVAELAKGCPAAADVDCAECANGTAACVSGQCAYRAGVAPDGG